jgi:ABC-type uncharacterized transport system substrate-binding protein
VPTVIRRLALGLGLIALASAILLVADRGHRTTAAPAATPAMHHIAVLQHANTPVLDDSVRGTLDALAARGYRKGETLQVDSFNAQGDMAMGVTIAKQLASGGYDLVITSSTPSMQAVANTNRDGKVRHLFTTVADPFESGVGLDRADPLKHPAYLIGQGSFPPVDKAFAVARQMLPSLKTIGVAWNPAESNSLVFVKKGRALAAQMGFDLIEANADNTAAVGDAVNALIARGAQAIWVGGDNTVIAGINTVVAVAKRSGIPVFTVLPGAPDRGTLFDAGPNFYEVGRQGGLLAADILEGADITKIPVRDVLDVVPPYLSVNLTALQGLKAKWQVPGAVRDMADVVVDDTGIHKKGAPAGAASAPAAASADTRPLAKTWRLSFVQLNNVVDVEDAEKGVLLGLKESGLVQGRDYTYQVRNAQGDMATVSTLVDASAADSDLIVTFSTPTLQAAVQRAKRVPVVFNYVSDAVAAGAATDDTHHAPNVTGVYLAGAYGQMVPLIRKYLPTAKTLGTVYVPAEANMVSQKPLLEQAARENGFELKAVAANTTAEVADATLALLSAHVDAICQIPGNLTAAAFPSIAQHAVRAKVPIFAFQSAQVDQSVLTLARDYSESGRLAGQMAARVMRGESPAQMPLQAVSSILVIVNEKAGAAAGLVTPPDVRAKAQKTIR